LFGDGDGVDEWHEVLATPDGSTPLDPSQPLIRRECEGARLVDGLVIDELVFSPNNPMPLLGFATLFVLGCENAAGTLYADGVVPGSLGQKSMTAMYVDLIIDGDADDDGMTDRYEFATPCLDPDVADASGDADSDTLANSAEHPFGASPCVSDSDGDRCSDSEEIGADRKLGGLRVPSNEWDFFDVPAPAGPALGADGNLVLSPTSIRNRAVTLQDVGVVLAYVGRTSTAVDYQADYNGDAVADGRQMDRTPSVIMAEPWRSGPPNNAVSLQDVGVALAQVGDRCVAPP
jgi:hypothetical protein